MTSELSQQAWFDNSGLWADPDPHRCPCGGRGWLCSDLDFWVKCPVHGDGVPHPEDESDEAKEYNHKEHRLQMLRDFLLLLQETAVRTGAMTAAEFRRMVEDRGASTPEEWVEAARQVNDTATERYLRARETPPEPEPCHEDADGLLDEDLLDAERRWGALADRNDYYSRFDLDMD